MWKHHARSGATARVSSVSTSRVGQGAGEGEHQQSTLSQAHHVGNTPWLDIISAVFAFCKRARSSRGASVCGAHPCNNARDRLCSHLVNLNLGGRQDDPLPACSERCVSINYSIWCCHVVYTSRAAQ